MQCAYGNNGNFITAKSAHQMPSEKENHCSELFASLGLTLASQYPSPASLFSSGKFLMTKLLLNQTFRKIPTNPVQFVTQESSFLIISWQMSLCRTFLGKGFLVFPSYLSFLEGIWHEWTRKILSYSSLKPFPNLPWSVVFALGARNLQLLTNCVADHEPCVLPFL